MSGEIRMSLVGIDAERAYSKGEVWAFYSLPTTPYDFVDDDSREQLAKRIDNALAGLVTNATKSIECQLIVTATPLNVLDWQVQWEKRVSGWGPTAGFQDYVNDLADHLYDSGFSQKEVYLGVLLGKRSGGGSDDSSTASFKGALRSINDLVGGVLGADDYQISDAELKIWEERGKEVRRILLSGNLRAVPATPDQIAMMYKRTLYPAMPTPPTDLDDIERWGYGDVLSLADAYVEKHRKFVKITQVDPYTGKDVVGYRATLCFARFPDVMDFPTPNPWMHAMSLLGEQVDMYSRFTLEPSAKVRKAVDRKIQEIKDEATNAGGTGGNIPLGIQERLYAATALEHELSRDADPWVYARHRIVVTAPTEEELRDKVQHVINLYKDLQIKVVWPTGDQVNLLLEAQPADKVRLSSYLQRQSLSVISGGMPTANSSVGDRREGNKGWIGPYLGETTSRVREPVFFSPHAVIARNNAPGVLITGSPGGGKSFTAFTMTCHMALQGIWCIYIDPKADALPIQNIPGLGHVNTFDLRNGNEGILDPFSIGVDEGDKILLAMETISLLVGGISDMQNVALADVLERVVEQPDPSLDKVVDMLRLSKDPAALSLGTTLNLIRKLPFARLCFSPQTTVNLRPDQGLTIVTLLGLDLPASTVPRSDYSLPNKLAVAVMFLLTSFTRQLMMSLDQKHPKAVIIDEAWAVTATSNGLKMISEIARMGRSLNTALILVSQNASDFTAEGLTNSISTKLAFRAKTKGEINGVLDLYGLDHTEENRASIQELQNGECLMQDVDMRTTTVQIDAWNQIWTTAFNTNPETKGDNRVKEAA